MEIDRRAFLASIGGPAAVALMDHEAKAEAPKKKAPAPAMPGGGMGDMDF